MYILLKIFFVSVPLGEDSIKDYAPYLSSQSVPEASTCDTNQGGHIDNLDLFQDITSFYGCDFIPRIFLNFVLFTHFGLIICLVFV